MTIFERYPPRPREELQIAGAAKFIDWTWRGFALGLALLMAALAIGPRVMTADQQSTCVGNIELPGPFGFSLNCDSPQFMYLARQPSALLEPGNERQTRPMMVFAAAALQDIVSLVVKPGGEPREIRTGFLDPNLIT